MDSNARRRPNNQTNQYHEDEVQVLTGPKTSTIGGISSFEFHGHLFLFTFLIGC